MVVNDQTVRRCPPPDAVHIANWSRFGYYFREGMGNFRACRRRRVVASQWARLQRLDMGLDFSAGAELAADLALKSGDDLMRIAMRQAAVEFDVETDRSPPLDFLDGHVMNRNVAFGRDQKNAFEHRLVVA